MVWGNAKPCGQPRDRRMRSCLFPGCRKWLQSFQTHALAASPWPRFTSPATLQHLFSSLAQALCPSSSMAARSGVPLTAGVGQLQWPRSYQPLFIYAPAGANLLNPASWKMATAAPSFSRRVAAGRAGLPVDCSLFFSFLFWGCLTLCLMLAANTLGG